jgi:hypothetical protein
MIIISEVIYKYKITKTIIFVREKGIMNSGWKYTDSVSIAMSQVMRLAEGCSVFLLP